MFTVAALSGLYRSAFWYRGREAPNAELGGGAIIAPSDQHRQVRIGKFVEQRSQHQRAAPDRAARCSFCDVHFVTSRSAT